MSKDFYYASNEDHALFQLIKKRDKKAFSVVYQKYHSYLYTLSLRYLKDRHLAEDIVQYVFVKLWERSEDIEIEINLKNYLYTMTKNNILNHIRNNKETISLNYANAQKEIIDEVDFSKLFDDYQLSESLHEGIRRLPPQKREICSLKMEGDLSNQQIADKMGISINTVKSHYQEAIKVLRIHFQKIKLMLF